MLLRAIDTAGLQVGTALSIVLVEALGALDGFQLGFDNYSYNSCFKDL